jgi:hypothetical protein
VTVVRRPNRLRKRVAVAPIGVAVAGEGMTNYAEQIRVLLISELRMSRRFIVVEPENFEGILLPGEARAVEPAVEQEADTGGLLGAQLLIKADLNGFDVLATDASPAAGAPPGTRLRVALRLQVFDPASGALIASEPVSAEAQTSDLDLRRETGAFRWDDLRLQSGPLGTVARTLVQAGVARILAVSEQVAWRASVIKATANEVYFNAGEESGVRVSHRFQMLTVGEPLTDPDSGRVMGREEHEIGEIEVVRVDERYSVGRVISKRGPIRRLDKVVERPQKP